MQTLMTNLQKWATGRVVLALLLLAMAVYFFMLSYTIPKVESFAKGMVLFDMLPGGYSYQYATLLLDELGETGRSVYLSQQILADLLYPGLFAASFTLLLFWIFNRIFEKNSKMFYFALFPILGGIFDYLENICIVIMLNTFPDFPKQLVMTASMLTILKSTFTTLSFILVIIGVVAIIIKKIRPESAA